MDDPNFADEIQKHFADEIQKHNDSKKKLNHSSSSSDSEISDFIITHSTKNRLFGRQKPLHLVLGGGKTADIILWRCKKVSGSIFAAVTVLWLLFECVGYHFLTLVCHALILSLTTLFLWSNLASFANISPPEFPTLNLPNDLLAKVLLLLTTGINQTLETFREVASGKDLKSFLSVTFVLWVISVVGKWFHFLTLCYLLFVMLQTAPVLYEKNEDLVDSYAEKAWIEAKKQYVVLDEKFLHKVPFFPSHKNHKQH